MRLPDLSKIKVPNGARLEFANQSDIICVFVNDSCIGAAFVNAKKRSFWLSGQRRELFTGAKGRNWQQQLFDAVFAEIGVYGAKNE